MTDDGRDTAGLARRCAEAMYAADEASRRLGISVDRVEPGGAVARMAVDERMVNGHGIAHGGYLFLLADTAFALACNTYGEAAVAAEAVVIFVAPARLGDDLEATATERVRYGRNGVYDVTVRRGSEVIAEFRGRCHTIGRRLVPEEAET
ncbi:MAG TPA: hydroxyphenylacetyl-CoA thioesterase PaaI [Mycobacteriales bacterium]|nr:hydroxyphenylacetyl-CoA thioesterase PaaI [Mycobacteriales bacterium]